jgi:hypothetical protein
MAKGCVLSTYREGIADLSYNPEPNTRIPLYIEVSSARYPVLSARLFH